MIHLDSNSLVGAAERNSATVAILREWIQAGEVFAASSVAWSEFLNGPLNPGFAVDADFLVEGRIIPFGRSEAELSCKLFNHSGRRRGSQPDCFIAATAICNAAPLATHNRQHFALYA